MATTSPDNLRTPDSGDSYALVQDMGILADTVQNALIKRANAYVGTTAQRNAFTSQAPVGTIWSDTDGDRLVWKRGASDWESVSPPKEDTGWMNVSTPSGWSANPAIQVRVLDGVAYWRGRITPSSSKNGTLTIIPEGGVPVEARPDSIFNAMRVLPSNHSSSSTSTAMKVGAVNSSGSVQAWYGPANTDPLNLAGLSGYVVAG